MGLNIELKSDSAPRTIGSNHNWDILVRQAQRDFDEHAGIEIAQNMLKRIFSCDNMWCGWVGRGRQLNKKRCPKCNDKAILRRGIKL